MSSDSNPEISALRSQLFIQLIALVVVTGTLTVYLYRQASVAGKDLAAVRPQAQQVIANYNQTHPVIVSFVQQLIAYGQKDPVFMQQVLKKYGVGAANAPAMPPK